MIIKKKSKTTEKKFKDALINWLCEHNFANIDIDFELDFGYTYDDITSCINIGVENIGVVSNYFEQFMYEYGLEYIGIPAPVMCFLHELGHYNTIYSFSSEELWWYAISKEFSHGMSEHDEYFRYWSLPDEFAANMWEINYINSHIEDVEELCNIFCKAWSELITVMNPFDLVKE